MMHIFFVLSWFVCGNDECTKQPPPDVNVFWTRQECEAAGAGLVASPKDRFGKEVGFFPYDRSYTCSASHRFVPKPVVRK